MTTCRCASGNVDMAWTIRSRSMACSTCSSVDACPEGSISKVSSPPGSVIDDVRRRDRIRSTTLWWATLIIQDLGWPLSALKLEALSQMLRKVSWVASSANASCFNMYIASE